MAAAVPPIEISDDAHPGGIRCPDDKMDTGYLIHGADVGAERFIGLVERSLRKQMKLEVTQGWREFVRIMIFADDAVVLRHPEPIFFRLRGGRKDGLEQTGFVNPCHWNGAGRIDWQHLDVLGVGKPRAYEHGGVPVDRR